MLDYDEYPRSFRREEPQLHGTMYHSIGHEILAGDEESEQPGHMGQMTEEDVGGLWARALAHNESREQPQDSIPAVNSDININLDADLDHSPIRPHTRVTPGYYQYAAPLTRSTIRDFIACNMNGSVDDVHPSALSEVSVCPRPESKQIWECSGASTLPGPCALDTGYSKCASCKRERRTRLQGSSQFSPAQGRSPSRSRSRSPTRTPPRPVRSRSPLRDSQGEDARRSAGESASKPHVIKSSPDSAATDREGDEELDNGDGKVSKRGAGPRRFRWLLALLPGLSV